MIIEQTMTHKNISTPKSGRRIYLRRTTEGIHAAAEFPFIFLTNTCISTKDQTSTIITVYFLSTLPVTLKPSILIKLF